MCIIPWCASHPGIRLSGVHHTAESNCRPWNQNINFACHAHRVVTIFTLYDRISHRNRNRVRKYFSLFIRGPDGFESWKKLEVENLVTHTSFKGTVQLNFRPNIFLNQSNHLGPLTASYLFRRVIKIRNSKKLTPRGHTTVHNSAKSLFEPERLMKT